MSKSKTGIKHIIVTLLLCVHISNLYAQDKELKEPKLNIKLNASTLVGVVNPAVEFRVFNKGSVQLEGMLPEISWERDILAHWHLCTENSGIIPSRCLEGSFAGHTSGCNIMGGI